MPNYQPLIDYLYKNTIVDQDTALTLLSKYPSKQNRYRALNDLVSQNRLERTYEDGIVYYRIRTSVRPFITRTNPDFPESPADVYHWATAYRFAVRYGAQEFSAPGRINFMTVLKVWLNQWRETAQFVDRLLELVDNPPSKAEFLALERELTAAGWYDEDYLAIDRIQLIIDMMNPHKRENNLGITDESWNELLQLDNLKRVTDKH